jgi:hypothetical protein
MKNTILLLLFTILFVRPASVLAGGQQPEANVNSRYTVEKVDISGVDDSRISKSLRDEMQNLVGEKYDEQATHLLAKRLRKELPNYSVTARVRRGEKPNHVKVVFETERLWWKTFDIDQSKAVYHSKQGFSGMLNASFDTHHNRFRFGFVNSADEMIERAAGFRLGYAHEKLGTDRLRFRMDFESYHEQWNPATEFALSQSPSVPGIYRNRQNFAPELAVLPLRDLQLSVGTSFQQFQTQYPSPHTQTAYSGTAAVTYRRAFETSGGVEHRVNAQYTLRTATHVLDSDFVYSRHAWEGEYSVTRARHYFRFSWLAGTISGQPPLFERFSLGDSSTLRGWNKFDVAPMGGTRTAYGSFEYHYWYLQVFYDSGAVWDPGRAAEWKHAVGFGLSEKGGGAFITLGVPVRLHDVVPVLTLGIRF